MNVLSGTGLVGIVTEVGPNWATVSSIIDDKNVSAMILTTFDKMYCKRRSADGAGRTFKI